MGAKDPDLLNPPPTPGRGLTIAGVIGQKWLVTARCPACRARTHVDLEAIRRARGDDYVPWGARPRCKSWVGWSLDRRCEGRVVLLAQSCPNGSIREMTRNREVEEAIRRRRGEDPTQDEHLAFLSHKRQLAGET